MSFYMHICAEAAMDVPRPIGYWLKHLHDLLERRFESTLDDLGLGRRHWQVLTTLSRGPSSRDDLERDLAPFRARGAADLDAVLAELADRGRIRRDGDGLALTDEGRAVHTAAAARVEDTRAALLTGVTPEQYAETVRILSVMAANAEAGLLARSHPEREPRPGPAR
ncbi:MarR family winged helix-turn-helix transcriptional regulator [Nocardiopsis sp. NPDC050513]|uniref:MarR family winged helix-turn-helix transcriptional regulator n=1 Tax=Nocardiopsis sp. NPDC050513 TaxID=3364338 RepID=UPI0037B5C0E3